MQTLEIRGPLDRRDKVSLALLSVSELQREGCALPGILHSSRIASEANRRGRKEHAREAQ